MEIGELHKWASLSLFTGGADTTVSSLQSFFPAMMLYPEVQVKAQEEIDRVIETNRLPAASDRDNLPYLWATMKETHCWHPIPKGAVLLANTWWFTHDLAVYTDPMVFRPERFIETPGRKCEPDPRNLIFGYAARHSIRIANQILHAPNAIIDSLKQSNPCLYMYLLSSCSGGLKFGSGGDLAQGLIRGILSGCGDF